MTTTFTTLDNSQRTAAKVAGWSCLLTMAIVVLANYGLLNPLIVRGNAAATAENIVAHETQFRVAAILFLTYSAKPVNPYWFDSPMALFEMGLSFWLLFKGLRQPGSVEPIPQTSGARQTA
jgi:hypothetical protein